jgi:sugar-specific transcriptional regulator TrmB
MLLPQVLTNLGLNDKESKVYLACLELGTSSILEIAKKSGVNRGTIYYIIEELKQKQLISQTTKKKKVLYIAAEPSELMGLIKSKEEMLLSVLPDLNALNNLSVKKPKIRYYEGIEGIVKVIKNSLNAKKEILSFANNTQFNALIEAEPDYLTKRIKKNISVKLISPDSPDMLPWVKADKKELRQTKLISSKMYPFNIEIDIYDNFVNLTSYEEKIGVIIESQPITETMRLIFNLCWNSIK